MEVMDFPSKKEPYVIGKVWETVEVYKCNVKNPWKFNRSQSLLEEREKLNK